MGFILDSTRVSGDLKLLIDWTMIREDREWVWHRDLEPLTAIQVREVLVSMKDEVFTSLGFTSNLRMEKIFDNAVEECLSTWSPSGLRQTYLVSVMKRRVEQGAFSHLEEERS